MKRSLPIVMLSLSVLGGCSEADSVAGSESLPSVSPELALPFTPTPCSVPRFGVDAFCDPELQKSSVGWCDWVHGNELLLLGEVVAVSAVLEPQVHHSTIIPSTDCIRPPSPAIAIELKPLHIYRGEFTAPSITVYAGADFARTWSPGPFLDESEELAWGAGPAGFGTPFEVGGTLVVGVVRVESASVWSLMGELPIGFEEAGIGVDPMGEEGQDCRQYVRPSAEGLSFDAIHATLANCEAPDNPDVDFLGWRQRIVDRPASLYAAICPAVREDPIDVGGCILRTDCEDPTHICVNEKCVPE